MGFLICALLALVAVSALPAPVARVQLHRNDPHARTRVLRGTLAQRRYSRSRTNSVNILNFADAQVSVEGREVEEKNQKRKAEEKGI